MQIAIGRSIEQLAAPSRADNSDDKSKVKRASNDAAVESQRAGWGLGENKGASNAATVAGNGKGKNKDTDATVEFQTVCEEKGAIFELQIATDRSSRSVGVVTSRPHRTSRGTQFEALLDDEAVPSCRCGQCSQEWFGRGWI